MLKLKQHTEIPQARYLKIVIQETDHKSCFLEDWKAQTMMNGKEKILVLSPGPKANHGDLKKILPPHKFQLMPDHKTTATACSARPRVQYGH